MIEYYKHGEQKEYQALSCRESGSMAESPGGVGSGMCVWECAIELSDK